MVTIVVMKRVSKSELKAKMLEYFREVERTGEPLEVTDRGRPVLKVVPIKKTMTIKEIQEKWSKIPVSKEFMDSLLEPMDPEDYRFSWEDGPEDHEL